MCIRDSCLSAFCDGVRSTRRCFCLHERLTQQRFVTQLLGRRWTNNYLCSLLCLQSITTTRQTELLHSQTPHIPLQHTPYLSNNWTKFHFYLRQTQMRAQVCLGFIQWLKQKKFKDFSSTFKDLPRFRALSRALNFKNRIQALSRIFQALYESCMSLVTLSNIK